VKYFDSVLNVGDQINPYLIKAISGKEAYNVKTGIFQHLVGLGSMFHVSNRNSIIWGTGIISEEPEFKYRTSCRSVTAVRGLLTEKIIKENGTIGQDQVVMGDPGILMPLFYFPKVEPVKAVGVIPHYVDANLDFLKDSDRFSVIDVDQSPEEFIDQLLSCQSVISSSLHGLILADAYDVPNKWVSFSDGITGGSFKFLDYYSTTNRPNEDCILIDGEKSLFDTVTQIKKYASIKKFCFDKKRLIDSFPML